MLALRCIAPEKLMQLREALFIIMAGPVGPD